MIRRKTPPLALTLNNLLLGTLLLGTLLLALPVEAGDRHGHGGPRWDRYQHHDFRDRGRHGYREHRYHHQPHYEYRDRHYVYRSDHYRGHGHRHGHGHGHHHGHRHGRDVLAIIGGAVLLNEILHH